MNSDQEKIDYLLAGLPPHKDSGFFGLDLDQNSLEIIPVAWDATTSYRDGTNKAPEQVRVASHQLDLEDSYYGKVFLAGIATKVMTDSQDCKKYRALAEKVISCWEDGRDAFKEAAVELEQVNAASIALTAAVRKSALAIIADKKIPALLGGDHSCPLGLIQAVDQECERFSILHLDAHHDLRIAYEGFKESHASIMYNVIESCPNLDKLVSIGIRDFSADEKDLAKNHAKISTYYDQAIRSALYNGETFASVADRIISELGPNVYVSADIDGLSPDFCPGTGTPVPGGLHFSEWQFLLHRLVKSGRKIVGFDLCEVGGVDEWDANVGARVLYNMCGAALASQELLKAEP